MIDYCPICLTTLNKSGGAAYCNMKSHYFYSYNNTVYLLINQHLPFIRISQVKNIYRLDYNQINYTIKSFDWCDCLDVINKYLKLTAFL